MIHCSGHVSEQLSVYVTRYVLADTCPVVTPDSFLHDSLNGLVSVLSVLVSVQRVNDLLL